MSSIRELEAAAVPVNDALDTLQHLARPLVIGLEGEWRAVDNLINEIKQRWAFWQANGAWPNNNESLAMPRASGRIESKDKKEGESVREPEKI
jgi:hypothetical protein